MVEAQSHAWCAGQTTKNNQIEPNATKNNKTQPITINRG